MSRTSRIILRPAAVLPLLAATLACLALAAIGAGRASAADAVYIGGNGSTFAAGAGGWTNSTSYDGLCLPPLRGVTCVSISGSHETSGGADGAGDGFLRTSESGTSLTSLLATSTNTWMSPSFVYDGAGGGTTPAGLEFAMKKRSEMGQLLDLGAEATYSVTAVNQSGGGDVKLVNPTSVGSNPEWSSAAARILGKNALRIGDHYRFAITTTVSGLAAVLPSGTVDYDDVVLTASSSSTGGPGGGADGGPGTEIAPPKVIPAGRAYLYRNRLYVRIRCPRKFKPACHIRAGVLSRKKKGKHLTRNVRLNVKAHTFKRKGLKVRPKFRKQVRKLSKLKRRTVWLNLHVKSKRGKKKGLVRHHLRVIHRVRK